MGDHNQDFTVCQLINSKTACSTLLKLNIVLSYILCQKPIEFGANWWTLITLIKQKCRHRNYSIINVYFQVQKGP